MVAAAAPSLVVARCILRPAVEGFLEDLTTTKAVGSQPFLSAASCMRWCLILPNYKVQHS
jgi:hypothetical protein